MLYTKFPGLWRGFPIIVHHSGHAVHLREFKQIRRQFSRSRALDRIHCSLTEFATRLSLVSGRPKVQRTRAVHTAVKACVKLCFILLLPGYSLLASMSVFSFFSLSLTFTVICFCGSLKMSFPGNDGILNLQSVDSWWADAGRLYQGKDLSVWVSVLLSVVTLHSWKLLETRCPAFGLPCRVVYKGEQTGPAF